MKICPVCKETYIDFDKTIFCVKDGARLKDFPRCQCGNEYGKNDKYCEFCGKEIGQEVN